MGVPSVMNQREFTIPTALRCLCLPCRGNESELQDKVEVYEPWYLGKQLVDFKSQKVPGWLMIPMVIVPQMVIIVLENDLSFLLLSSHNHWTYIQEPEKHLFRHNGLNISMS